METDPADFRPDPMEEMHAMRTVRAGFLDVAIEIEADLRLMLIGYFITESRKVDLFWDFYESRGTLGPVVSRFKKVLVAERGALAAQRDFSAEQVDALLHALDELVQHRNRFAHDPMNQHFLVDVNKGGVVRNEWRIGQRGEDGPYFTIESANEAYEKARACEELVMRVRMPLEIAAGRRPSTS
jgi:hypothetical protein